LALYIRDVTPVTFQSGLNYFPEPGHLLGASISRLSFHCHNKSVTYVLLIFYQGRN
jgi:hypothetical protein